MPYKILRIKYIQKAKKSDTLSKWYTIIITPIKEYLDIHINMVIITANFY